MKDIKDFSKYDFQILEFVSKNKPVKIEQIKNRFKNLTSIEERISRLSEPKFSKLGIFVKNTSVIIPIVDNNAIAYITTDWGETVLQDYKISQRNSNKRMWLKNAWIPIIVTIATNLLVIGIKALLPLILELFSNSH